MLYRLSHQGSLSHLRRFFSLSPELMLHNKTTHLKLCTMAVQQQHVLFQTRFSFLRADCRCHLNMKIVGVGLVRSLQPRDPLLIYCDNQLEK